MLPEIPPSLKPLLDTYVHRMESELPSFMIGFYLQGSLALGAYQSPISDIDFITVISRRATESDIQALRTIHQTLQSQYPDQPLSGSYLQANDLGKFEKDIQPYPNYQDGVLYPAGYNDINSVTWWLLKNRTLAVVGSDKLDFEVDWQKLRADMRENLNTYWARYTREPARVGWLLSNYGVQWAVLGVLRQFYTFKENSIVSKTEAGEYALKQLPQQWHRLIQEAINLREPQPTSFYKFPIVRAWDALRFLRYLIPLCNSLP